MNISKRLRHLASLDEQDRGIGRTTAIVQAVKDTGGIFIAHDLRFAKMIERQYKIPAKSVEVNLEGYHGPFFLDHHAVNTMFNKAANKIENLESELESTRAAAIAKIDRQADTIANLSRVRNQYGNAIVQLKNEIEELQKKMNDLVTSLGTNIETDGK